MQKQISEFLEEFISRFGTSGGFVIYVKLAILIVVVFFLCFIVNLIAKRVLLQAIAKIIQKTKTNWDNVLMEKKVFSTLSHLAPAVVIYATASTVFYGFSDTTIMQIRLFTNVYVAWIAVIVILNLLNAIQQLLEQSAFFAGKPLDSFFQLAKMIVYLMGFIVILSIVMNKSPFYFLTALGTMTAILMLVFKDIILGLVASIQLVANDMLKEGDWVEIPKHQVDGNVLKINLTTIQIQNFDKTISNVPSYAFISESFKNWRGMQESGGRRIKRSFNLKIRSVKFCDSQMLEKYKQVTFAEKFITEKEKEFDSFNKKNKIDTTTQVNGKYLTNLGIFRAYLEVYLKAHEDIHKEMTYMVRQLAPSTKGIPLEIYAFSNKQQWVVYEGIAADIFDHIFATISFFDLDVFEDLSGSDLKHIVSP